MGKIFCIMGKSASGKDTLYNRLSEEIKDLGTYVMYTTRPMRAGEEQGREYHFISEDELSRLEREGKIIEKRCYNTMCGPWTYCTVDDGQIDPEKRDYLITATLEAYQALSAFFGRESLVPIYLELEDGERLERALKRERMEKNPKYEELCRRFLADNIDFSEERLREAGIKKRFDSTDLNALTETVKEEIFKDRS